MIPNLIEWATPYMPIANDGFKAELLWWKWVTGAQVEIPLMTFNTPEGLLYASAFDARYSPPASDEGAETSSEYTRLHLRACHSLHNADIVPLELDGAESNNDAVHKILWAAKFGQRLVAALPPQVVLSGLMSADDNEHAMSVMAMRLLGHNTQVRAGITEVELSPQTYHAALVADVCSHLPKIGA